MPATRTATARTVVVTASDLHAHDVLMGTEPGTTFRVDTVQRRGTKVLVTLWGGRAYALDAERPVTVQAEHPCDCGGTGIYAWGGSVNGVPAHVGEHFACHGKGYQDRQDVIRNATYWNKYARI
jgi:hypothetical protein